MIGELPVGVAMIEEAEGVVEALLIRLPGRARRAEPPFADHRGAIARRPQHLGDRDVFGPQRNVLAVAANPGVTGVQPGHQRRPRRRADRAARVVLREPDAFAREPIERRRLEPRLPVGAEIAVAEIVGLNQQDVRRPWRLRALSSRIRPISTDRSRTPVISALVMNLHTSRVS